MIISDHETNVGGWAKGRICLLTSSFPCWKGDSTAPFVLHFARDLEVLAPHAVEAPAVEGRVYLLPAVIALPFELGQPPERRPLFDRVYTF